jgi:hypothetical protein
VVDEFATPLSVSETSPAILMGELPLAADDDGVLELHAASASTASRLAAVDTLTAVARRILRLFIGLLISLCRVGPLDPSRATYSAKRYVALLVVVNAPHWRPPGLDPSAVAVEFRTERQA